MKHGWNGQLARIWTKMVGPSRPTISELAVYEKYAKILQEHSTERLKLLVLGSTPEFRDWGYENNFDITVMDCNPDYYEEVTREIRHKCIKEKLIIKKWQELDCVNEYDIIIGDLAIGNIPPNDLENFIARVSRALTKNGIFLGKSFYNDKKYTPLSPHDLVEKYYNDRPWHPYSYFVYDLSIYCMDSNNLLSFPKQYSILENLYKDGILNGDTFEYFKDVGWDSDMKFLFHIPNLDEYEDLLKKYLNIFAVEYGNDVYSPHFPLHIVGRKDNEILSSKENK